jgi:membrane protein insertase Oxa1/YidC/SpoIIIJ
MSNTIATQHHRMRSLAIRNFASNSNSKDQNAELFDNKSVTRLSTTTTTTTNDSADKIVTKTLMESEENAVRDTVVHQMVTVNGTTFDVNDCWWNTKAFMSVIDGIHSVGLPWWLTLFASVVALRLDVHAIHGAQSAQLDQNDDPCSPR